MITLSTIPAVVLARDPLPVTFLTDNYKQVNGSESYHTVAFTSLPGADDLLNVASNAGNFVFTCKAIPDDSGLQFETPDIGDTIDNYVQRVIVPFLKTNYDFCQLFKVEYVNNTVNITIRSILKDNYNIQITATGFTISGVYGSAGTADVYRENFKINYQLYNYTTNLPVSAAESLEPNADGRLVVNISELVQGFAKSSFDFDTTDFAVLLPDDSFKFYLKYWESYGIGDAFTNRVTKQNNAFTAIDGATSWIDQAKLNEQGDLWYDSLTKNIWLTRKPIASNILPDQKVLLKILAYTTNYGIMATIRTTNSVGTVAIIQHALNNPIVNQVFQINVSPQFLGLANDIVKMEVYLENNLGGAYLSDILTFNIDRNYYNNIRYFFFRNSFGGFDTLQSLGLGSVKESYERMRATSQLAAQHTRKDRETKVLAVNQETNFKVNMGFSNNWGESNQAWANYIRQLYSTLEAYEIIMGTIYPIDILTSDAKLLEDENYLPDFLELEYTRAYVEKGATSEIPALQGSYTNQYSESYD